jgi:drug/metabolite transporter (DMT)-like permease
MPDPRPSLLVTDQPRPAGLPPAAPLTGILLLIAGSFVLPAMDSAAKVLAQRYSITEVVWARYLFNFLLMIPLIVARYGLRGFLPPRPTLQVLRAVVLMISTAFYFWGISRLPIADALALAFVNPLVVTALAPFLLGEAVGLRRWAAVVIGFSGALLVIRPGFDGVEPLGAGLSLGAGITYGIYLIITRKLAGSATPLVTLAFTALVGSIVMSAVVPFAWTTPTLDDLGLMVLMGALALAANYLVIRAFDYAPASLLAPFGYAEMIGATGFGYLFFGDFPDAWTWAGIAVIIASGIYISLRERKLAGR